MPRPASWLGGVFGWPVSATQTVVRHPVKGPLMTLAACVRNSVRREKSAISSGCESHPANRSLGRKHQSDGGGNKSVEVLWCNGSPWVT
jgi:hypothetical protein